MSDTGIEIDMLSLGDADSILVTKWTGDDAQRVLIDGGNADSSEVVQSFLKDRGIRHIENVVCSHPHNDHAAGLIPLLRDSGITVSTLWVHQPQKHPNLPAYRQSRYRDSPTKRVRSAVEGLERIDELVAVAEAKSIEVNEPFAGHDIGFLEVCGPSIKYYRELLPEFADLDHLESQDRKPKTFGELYPDANAPSDSLLFDPHTSPENNSSTILTTELNGHTYLFTADAGAQALQHAAGVHDLARCWWMQIPHHGSRHNITANLINRFSPENACVSASGKDHPHQAVVDAFRSMRTEVYSTHYPQPAHLWFYEGVVQVRPDYGAATPLRCARPPHPTIGSQCQGWGVQSAR